MLRAILGLLKGGIVGAAIGWAATKLGIGGGFTAGLSYAIVGALAGIVCGRPPWRQDTFWTSAIKGIVGLAVGIGLFFAARKLLGSAHVGFAAALGAPPDRPIAELPILLGPAIGALWGAIVEVDDGGSSAKDRKPPA